MLTLPIKKKWFDMILSGEKKDEYRKNTAYWRRRLLYMARQHGDEESALALVLRNGYRSDSPKAMVEIEDITVGTGRPEWGAEPGVEYLRLHIKKAVKLDDDG